MHLKSLLAAVVACLSLACQSTGSQSTVPHDPTPAEIQAALAECAPQAGAEGQSLAQNDKPLMLVFWQSWCGSCVQEAPQVQRAFQRFGSQIAVVGVVSGPDSSVDADHLSKTILRLGVTYPQFRDRDNRLTRLFQVSGTPDVVILNRERKVVYRGHELPKAVEAYL